MRPNWLEIAELAEADSGGRVYLSAVSRLILLAAINADAASFFRWSGLSTEEKQSAKDALERAESELLMAKNLRWAKAIYSVPSGENGGTSLANQWQARPLNAIDGDLTLSGNGIVFPVGRWRITAVASGIAGAGAVNNLRLQMRSTLIPYAQSANYQLASASAYTAILDDVVNVTTNNLTLTLSQYINVGRATIGLGAPASIAGVNERYTVVVVQEIET